MTGMIRRLVFSSAMHLVIAAGVSGVAAYVYLIVVARSVGPSEYSQFSLFWSVAVIAGLGLFLPLEQETSRVEASAQTKTANTQRVIVLSVSFGAVIAAVALCVVLVLTEVPSAQHQPQALVFAIIATLVGYCVQFPVRGVLAGRGQLTSYAVIIGSEGALRICLAIVISLVFPGSLGALAGVVAIASAASVIPALISRRRRAGGTSRASILVFGTGVARLVAAALMVQLLMNFPPLLAYLTTGGSSAVPGVLLAAVSLARIPIFVYQSMQGAILPRIARAIAQSDVTRVRRICILLISGCFVVASLWTALLGLVGPALIRILFGRAFEIPQGELAIVVGALGLLLVAMVTSDCVMATGGHTFVTLSWMVGVLVAITVAGTLHDVILRSTLPVACGALMALAILLVVLVVRIRAIRVPRTKFVNRSEA